MEIIQCNLNNLEELTKFYDKIILYLDKTINYPLWIYGVYPCESTIKEAINKKYQYACIENGKIIGAFVLNEDPGGTYENAKIEFNRGEYLVIHTLATDYDLYRKGIATKMIKYCIEKAKNEGYKAVYCDIVPTNTPSKSLFTKNGFKYLGDFNLDRSFKNIPLFSILELKL